MGEIDETRTNLAGMQSAAFVGSAAFFAIFCVSGLVACGGIDESDLFAGGDGGASSSSDSGKADSAAKDGSAVVDSGPSASGNVVACTSGPCNVGDAVCCESPDGTGTCTRAPNCTGDKQLPIPCDDANDCTQLGHPGDLCCATGDNNGNVTSVECRSVSNCRPDNGQTNLCDPTASAPCTNGGTCTPSVSLPGYYLCVM